jgi:hypothetical protein
MRELIGKVRTKDRNVIEEVYLSPFLRCRECQVTVPMGIEVVTVKRDGVSKRTVLSHRHYCRAHGLDYQMMGQSPPIRAHVQHRST